MIHKCIIGLSFKLLIDVRVSPGNYLNRGNINTKAVREQVGWGCHDNKCKHREAWQRSAFILPKLIAYYVIICLHVILFQGKYIFTIITIQIVTNWIKYNTNYIFWHLERELNLPLASLGWLCEEKFPRWPYILSLLGKDRFPGTAFVLLPIRYVLSWMKIHLL